ncbi:probable serine/threonine-protein kinase pats1, partial [Saccostrea cucullata]|uniref:probable serine/threonine-protein kinase pats1 n=1 Tax=Saccostrea cuccullata TaxID=36930 RepID=UPI002ED1E262
GVPAEVLKWDQEARVRYVEYLKTGTQTVHHARGMIVGCAGAGKTTLIKRLLGFSEEEIKKVKSTEGLEVHEEIFDICDETKSLKVRRPMDHRYYEKNKTDFEKKTLTLFDFGGQCAYYACHQIYLTRRAFYVVVVDASKRLDQKVDKKVCDQGGSVFSGWTYGDYFVFWIKSIHTYCGSENDNEKDQKPIVMIAATHWKKRNRQFKDKKELMESLQCKLPESSRLSQYIEENNVYCVDLTLPLHDLEKSLFNIASDQRWSEQIPKEWSIFGKEIYQKRILQRILKIFEITKEVQKITNKGQNVPTKVEKTKENLDMLRYYHDAGKALYFNENGLNENIIIDVQWFIDAFKHIITDEIHFRGIPGTQREWNEYYNTGRLRDGLLIEIWKHKDKELFDSLKKQNKNYRIREGSFEQDELYLQCHKKSLLNFMQRLGLLAAGGESHYVPCMNRKKIEKEFLNLIKESKSKSSVLIYQFEFLPFFLFFRLVVACIQENGWNVPQNQGTSCLYKNAALFSYMEYNILLSVTEESIQLQVFCPIKGPTLETEKTCLIQGRIEELLNDLAGTFHRKIQYERGFRCRMDKKRTIAIDIKDHFLPAKDIPNRVLQMMCPLHSIKKRHIIDTTELTRYWKL